MQWQQRPPIKEQCVKPRPERWTILTEECSIAQKTLNELQNYAFIFTLLNLPPTLFAGTGNIVQSQG